MGNKEKVIMKKIRPILLVLGGWIIAAMVAAASQPLSFDFQSIDIQDVLRMMAKNMQQNIVISPQVSGNISLHLEHVTAAQAFNFILQTHGLVRVEKNQVWWVLTRAEFLQQKQEESKVNEMVAARVPLEAHIWQIRYAKVEDIAHILAEAHHSLLSTRGFLHVDARTNQLYVQDIHEKILLVGQLIQRVDIPVKQILIEARLASVDSDFEQDLGIHFSVRAPGVDPSANPTHYGLAVAKLADGSLLDVKLAALENTGHGELISSPSLFTANRQLASIESGEEIPYQQISRSGATGVTFKKAVLSLKVIPQVLPGNQVLLQLQVNQDRPNNRMVLGVPAITTRQISTHILVANGQTVVLGGIFESTKDNDTEGIPFLNRLPVLGRLFQQHSRVENKRELLIFVTPKVI